MNQMSDTATHTTDMPESIRVNDHIILFDSVCKLCNAWSKFIIRFDRAHVFKLCSVQSKEGKQILRYFDYPENTFETMLLVKNGACFEKSDAFFKVMQGLGWPWKMTLLFSVLPAFIRDWLYDRIALNRYALFGKYDHCILPSPDHAERFIDGKHASF